MQIALKSLFEAPLDRPEVIPGVRFGRGWHAAEDTPWSRSPRAFLRFSAEQFPVSVPMRLRLQAFNAGPDRPKRLRVCSPGHDPVCLTVTTPDPVALRVSSPRHAADAVASLVTLEIDTLDSPFLTGRSADERLLGLAVTELLPGIPELAFPLEFTPAACGSNTVLAQGWGPVEEGGVWTIGTAAVLHLPGELAPLGPAELQAEAAVLPCPEGQDPLEVEIREAGECLVIWRFPSGTAGPWRCPLPEWNNTIDRRLELVIRNARTPASLGINADERPLGLQLKRLGLSAMA